MKKIFFLIAVLFSFTGMAQTVGQLRYDTVKMYKVGGTTELILQNASSGVVGGVLRNVINGRTVFQAVVDSIYSNATQDSIVYVIAGTRRAFKYSSGGGGSGWGLSGNAITTGDFLGTTNNEDLVFKRNNIESGRINTVLENTSFGESSLITASSGNGNSAFGVMTLLSLTSGAHNTSIGEYSMISNESGSNNVAVGSGALSSIVSTNNNTGVGFSALTINTANSNTAIGYQSLAFNTTGSRNIGVGDSVLYNNITGKDNTAIGYRATTSTSSTDSSVAIGYEAVASNKQLAFSPHLTTMFLDLDSASGTAPAIAGIDANGNWRKYATPSGSGGVTLSQMNDSLAAIRDTIQFDGTMNVNTVGQLTTAGVDTSVVATRHYADSVAAASGGGTAIPNNEVAFGNGTGITSNSDFFYSTGSGGLFNVGFSGNVILQKTGNNYYFGDKDGINNQTYLHVNDGSKLVTVNADSLKLGSVKVALQATDSTGSPTNMIYQGTDGLLHKAAVPSGSGGTPAGNYGNIQINRNGVFDTPGSDTLTFDTGGLTVKSDIISTSLMSAPVYTSQGVDMAVGVPNQKTTIGDAFAAGIGTIADIDDNTGTITLTAGNGIIVTNNLNLSGAFMPNNLSGTAGQKLTSAGAGTPPTWKDTLAVSGVYAPLASPTFTGTVTAPTVSVSTTVSGAGTWTAGAINTASNVTANLGLFGGGVRAGNNTNIYWNSGPVMLGNTNDLTLKNAAGTAGANVSIGSAAAVASAQLEVTSTTKGFLPPRMTATQGSAISSPAEGLLIYVTDTNGTFTAKGWWGYDGAAWQKLNN